MSKEGLGIIVGMALLSGILLAASLVTGHFNLKIAAGISIFLTVFIMYFFRDPERTIPAGANNILSPADGKVVDIREHFEDEFLQEKCTRVSIFLSVFNVHVNRIPIAGAVKYFRYQKGAFVNAYKSDASEINEQTVIGIENGKCNILFKQIAGLIARRIVCNIREGDTVNLGERFGIIKFGSRVDIFFPKNVEVKVKLKEKVKGGQSIIGVIKT
ncbi:MAG: phosphatidylserine decarboxylase family protein [Caldithrix sp.]|nr:MAG: phosphatidylserine decarboxylase family protein [Caldithrix sp.]